MADSCLSEEEQIVIQSFSSMIFTEIGCAKKKFKIPMCQFSLMPESGYKFGNFT